MVRINKIVCALLVTLFSGVIIAQNNTNSPYTRYGYGQLVDQGFGKSKGMGGVAYALRDNSQINPLNPASYTAIDSLTFIFEGGASMQNTNFSDGKTKLNAKNSSFDYLALQFRLKKWMAMSAGVLPMSNVGYRLNEINTDYDNEEAYNVITRDGDGGLHQFYIGMGFKPFNRFAFGANISYVWGDINRNTTLTFPNSPVESNRVKNRNTSIAMKGVKFDFGVQYIQPLSQKSDLTIGAVYSPKMRLSNDVELVSVQNVLVVTDTTSSFQLPHSFGLGVAYNWAGKLTASMDVLHQKWSSAKYMGNTKALSDLTRIGIGAEYMPNPLSRKYFANVRYRLGFHYSDSYYKINNRRASREYGISGGFGLPIPKTKSIINISAQYIRVDGRADNLLKENYLRINIGLVFNERWFFKRKI